MALDLTIWLIITGLSLLAFFFGITAKIKFIFLIGLILLAVSGMALFAYNGLIIEKNLSSINDDGQLIYSEETVTTENTGLFVLGLTLIVLPLVSFMVFDFGEKQTAFRGSAFHY